MHPGLLDVLHDAADQHVLAVADGIHVDLDSVVQEAVQEHRRFVGDAHCAVHIAHQLGLVVDDLHGPAAQDVGRAHHQGISDGGGLGDGVGFAARGGVGRLLELQLMDQLLEPFPVLGPVDGIWAGADDGHPGRLQGACQLQWGLAAVLDDDPFRLLLVHDLQDVLQGQGLEIQPVGGVVVGGDGLRIAIDHDGLVAVLAERKGGMDTAIVELDPLADPVGSAAQDHDLAPVRGLSLALLLVGGIHIGGAGGELRGAGIHALVNRAYPQRMAARSDVLLVGAQQATEPPVGEPWRLSAYRRGPSKASRPSDRTWASVATRSSIWARNQGSMALSEGTSARSMPSRKASAR